MPYQEREQDQRQVRLGTGWSLVHLVIAGYHGSASARNALAYAAGMARRLGRPLLVVYVTRVIFYTDPISGMVVKSPEDVDALERWLLDELDHLPDRGGLEVHVRARRGASARQLAACAAELNADGLVIGASAHRWKHRAGSVPAWLVRHASCPVITVP